MVQSVVNPQNTVEVIGELKSFVNHKLLDGEESGIEAATPLLEVGILNSLAMVSLLAFVEDKFGFSIPEEEITPENFFTLKTIAELVARTGGNGLESVRDLEVEDINQHRVKLDSGEEIHFLKVAGLQPTWVLLPGLGNPSSTWEVMLQSLKEDNEAIAVDFAGFGLSSSPTETPTYSDHLRSMLKLLDQNIVEPPFLIVSSSTSAIVATEIARQRKEWVHSLVITGFGLNEEAHAWWKQIQSLSQSSKQFLESAYYRPPTLTADLQRFLEDGLSCPAFHSFFEGSGFEAMRICFENISVPTLFVAGDNDRIVPKSAIEAAASRVPGAQLDWLARCGHFPSVEQPEELLYVIRNFLKSIDRK